VDLDWGRKPSQFGAVDPAKGVDAPCRHVPRSKSPEEWVSALWLHVLQCRELGSRRSRFFSAGSCVAGGVWAYYKFRLTDEAEISAVVAVSGEVLPYSCESRLLLLHVRPKNIGPSSMRQTSCRDSRTATTSSQAPIMTS
jgi:hypothetical protein